jgi:uncharacterized protein with HEPN domain
MSNILLHLDALIESIDKIEQYSCEFNDADELYHDSKSFDAIMMQFVVIGETISRMDEDFKKNQNQIPWQKIKDFRNIIAHDYFGIDADEIWGIIKEKILPLRKDISKIIDLFLQNSPYK